MKRLLITAFLLNYTSLVWSLWPDQNQREQNSIFEMKIRHWNYCMHITCFVHTFRITDDSLLKSQLLNNRVYFFKWSATNIRKWLNWFDYNSLINDIINKCMFNIVPFLLWFFFLNNKLITHKTFDSWFSNKYYRHYTVINVCESYVHCLFFETSTILCYTQH